jgi:hypothetical protein
MMNMLSYAEELTFRIYETGNEVEILLQVGIRHGHYLVDRNIFIVR